MRYVDADGMPVTVYEPNETQGGFLWVLKKAVSDVVASRHVITRLFWRDFIAQYRQKLLGYLWALINPLLAVVSFLFLFFIGVLNPGQGEIPYAAYVMVGTTIWGCLPAALGTVGAGLQTQADLIMRTRVPKLALAVSSLAGVFYGILLSMVTISVILVFTRVTPSWWLMVYPLLVLPMVLLGTAMGLVLSVLGSMARDLTAIVTQVLTFLMYVTPVIYVRSTIQNPLVKTLIDWNPITYLVDVPRSLICLGRSEDIAAYLLTALGTAVLVTVGLRIFYVLEDLTAERL
jgi:lipopolysaccharide transport system permease protein